MNGPVEVFGLEGLMVTEKAKEVVEQAGYEVILNRMPHAKLLYLRGQLGVSYLPIARLNNRTLQGMREIRDYFAAHPNGE